MAPVCNHFFGIDSFFAGSQSPSYYLLMIGTPNLQVLLHPPKLISPLKRVHFKRISKGRSSSFFFRGHASFQGSKSGFDCYCSSKPPTFPYITVLLTLQFLKPWQIQWCLSPWKAEVPSFPLHGFNCSLHGSPLGRCSTSSRNFSSHTPFFTQCIGLIYCIWVN